MQYSQYRVSEAKVVKRHGYLAIFMVYFQIAFQSGWHDLNSQQYGVCLVHSLFSILGDIKNSGLPVVLHGELDAPSSFFKSPCRMGNGENRPIFMAHSFKYGRWNPILLGFCTIFCFNKECLGFFFLRMGRRLILFIILNWK